MSQHPASYDPGEHIGHISRETALVMSEVMDDENNAYGRDFIFVCRLREDTNHTVDGYAVDIVMFSKNSDSWTNLMIEILNENNITSLKLSR